MRDQGKIEIEIQGTSPLLMNKFHIEALETKSITKRKTSDKNKYGTPEEQAEKSAYWMQDKRELCIPSEIMMAVMLKAAIPFTVKPEGKSRGISLSYVLAGAIKIDPFEIPLSTSKFEIDSRGVVVQRNRIVRHRAKVPNWKVSFNLLYDKSVIDIPNLLKDVLEDGGMRVGIMDYSPRHKGPFGCFVVKKFEVV